MKYLCVALLVSFLLFGCPGKPNVPQETATAQITSGLDAKLFVAISRNDMTAVKSAIDSGANVNALHQGLFSAACLDRASPLYFAVFNENATLVEFLLVNGADPSIPNGYNELPIEHAERRGFSEIVILLEKDYSFPDLPDIE